MLFENLGDRISFKLLMRQYCGCSLWDSLDRSCVWRSPNESDQKIQEIPAHSPTLHEPQTSEFRMPAACSKVFSTVSNARKHFNRKHNRTSGAGAETNVGQFFGIREGMYRQRNINKSQIRPMMISIQKGCGIFIGTNFENLGLFGLVELFGTVFKGILSMRLAFENY